jgi:hypothetical protein
MGAGPKIQKAPRIEQGRTERAGSPTRDLRNKLTEGLAKKKKPRKERGSFLIAIW